MREDVKPDRSSFQGPYAGPGPSRRGLRAARKQIFSPLPYLKIFDSPPANCTCDKKKKKKENNTIIFNIEDGQYGGMLFTSLRSATGNWI